MRERKEERARKCGENIRRLRALIDMHWRRSRKTGEGEIPRARRTSKLVSTSARGVFCTHDDFGDVEGGGENGGAVCGEPAAESKRVHQYSVRGRQLRRRMEGRTTWIPRAQIEQNEPW